jgi:hypothetical protein
VCRRHFYDPSYMSITAVARNRNSLKVVVVCQEYEFLFDGRKYSRKSWF